MTERPILFTADMVRAILGGRKTQTRRVIQAKLYDDEHFELDRFERYPDGSYRAVLFDAEGEPYSIRSPYGGPGDRLWVREAWRESGNMQRADGRIPSEHPGFGEVLYRADGGHTGPWRPSIHMPRWASRLILEVTGVHVERVQDISYEDVKAEGVPLPEWNERSLWFRSFRDLWNKINAGRGYGWDENPLVWVVEFRRVTG